MRNLFTYNFFYMQYHANKQEKYVDSVGTHRDRVGTQRGVGTQRDSRVGTQKEEVPWGR